MPCRNALEISSYLVFQLNVTASDKTNLIVVRLTTREKRSK